MRHQYKLFEKQTWASISGEEILKGRPAKSKGRNGNKCHAAESLWDLLQILTLPQTHFFPCEKNEVIIRYHAKSHELLWKMTRTGSFLHGAPAGNFVNNRNTDTSHKLDS